MLRDHYTELFMLIRTCGIGACLLMASVAHATPFDMTYQGRLTDTGGTALEGSHTLTIQIYGSSSSHAGQTFVAVPTPGGYFSVILNNIDSDWLSGGAQVGISVDSATEMAPRLPLTTTPMAALAQTTSSVRAISQPTGTCTPGELVFDTQSAGLIVCTTGTWPQGLSFDGTRFTWSDGSAASTCFSYRNPDDQHLYNDEGDGVYAIDPDGDGTPVDVLCDMTTDQGGWTLVASIDPSSQEHLTTAALRDTTLTSLSNYGKFSDALIATIKDEANGSRNELRLDASDAFTMTWDDCPFTADAAAAQGCEHGSAPSHFGVSLNTTWQGYPSGCWITYGWTGSGSVGVRGSNGVCGYSSGNTSGALWAR